MPPLARLIALLLLVLAAPALAAGPPDAAADKPAAAIATRAGASEDGDIAARIRNIYGQIAALPTSACACRPAW